MEKTVTTKEAVMLSGVLNSFPCEFLDNAALIQSYTTFRVAVRDVLKKFNDSLKSDRDALEKALIPLREEAAKLMGVKAELDALPNLEGDDKVKSDGYKRQLEALNVKADILVKEYDKKVNELLEATGSKKLLLTCNEEDYGKMKAKILDKAKELFVAQDGKSFDADRFEIILNLFK